MKNIEAFPEPHKKNNRRFLSSALLSYTVGLLHVNKQSNSRAAELTFVVLCSSGYGRLK